MTPVVCVDCGGPIDVETSRALADGPHHKRGDCDYSPFERHAMPNGTEVFYRDSDHSYYSEVKRTRGKWTGVKTARLPSPSTIAKFADPSPDNLMDWAARKQVEGVFQLGTLDNFSSPGDVVQALKKHKLTWRDLRDSAGDVGTAVHDAFEKGLHGTPVPLEDNPPEAQGHLIALDRFFNDHPEIEPLQTEAVVYSREHGFAGRFDARVRFVVKSPDERYEADHTALIDLKTGYVGKSAHLQMAGYKLAIRESGFGECDRMLILDTRDDGTYYLWLAHGTEAGFLHALSLYRESKSLDSQMKADWKAAELAA